MKPITELVATCGRSILVGFLAAALLAGCGGGDGAGDVGSVTGSGDTGSADSGSADAGTPVSGGDTAPVSNPSPVVVNPNNCTGFCANANSFLTTSDVESIIAQAVAEAKALGRPAAIAVVDRVGNVLGVFRMPGANNPSQGLSDDFGFVTVTSGRFPPVQGGLENVDVVPDTAAAIAKAVTGAFLSSEGNAFTTRTASQIVQQNFNPGEKNQPGGPLFGVQFSSLPCSDLNTRADSTLDGAGIGPQRSPLGLAADPGGLPLYKGGTPVGGIGVISDGIYGLDSLVTDFDKSSDELIAVAGTLGFNAPQDRLASRITVEGKLLRFSDVDFGDLASNPVLAPDFATINSVEGRLVPVRGYFEPAMIIQGTAFGQPASGVAPAPETLFPGQDGFILVDADGNNRYPPMAGTDDLLTEQEVLTILRNALAVANRARAQIRRPTSSQMRASISVVDTNGVILGIVRTRDAPVFGLDVSLQKARTAAFFSSSAAADQLFSAPNANYLCTPIDLSNPQVCQMISIGSYVTAVRNFLGQPAALSDGFFAFSDRGGGNLSRPFFPDGVQGYPNGPFSKPISQWSPFTDGLQLDLDFNQIIAHVLFLLGAVDDDVTQNCTATIDQIPNGIQIFPGSVPIFKGETLAGGVGVSGDGIEQDDMVSFLGLHNASLALGTVNNAPFARRSDQIRVPRFGINLRWVQCPQAPFLDSTEQNACDGK